MAEDMVKIQKEKDSPGAICCSDGDYYPYGTSLTIRDDMVDDLGVGALTVGDVVEVRGYAFVESKSEHHSKDMVDKNISLQLTTLKVERENDDRVKQLYGE